MSKRRKLPKEAFREAVKACPPLQCRDGLQAIKKSEGKGRIAAKDAEKILGSVAMDDDCIRSHPNSSRWDYVVGYDRENQVIAHFIEVHSAETSAVSEVEAKFDWLKSFLEKNRKTLGAFQAEFHWVASGRCNIPSHLPQYKKLHVTLRKRGLRFHGNSLVLN